MNKAISQLSQNLELFRTLFNGVDDSTIRWKSSPESWCFLEILCHLIDEEKEDFRARVISIWEDPAKDLTPISPKDWVTDRNYIAQDYNSKWEEFELERKKSIEMLSTMNENDPRWKAIKQHPHFGSISAQFFLQNWLAHDLLHIRQLIRIRYDRLQDEKICSIEYAGSWP